MAKPHGTAPSVSLEQGQEFLAAIARQARLKDHDPAVVQWWIEHQGALQEALWSTLKARPQLAHPAYAVTVDYGLTVEQMVAAGMYDWANSDINEKNFPHDRKAGKTDVMIHVVQFDRLMTSQEVEKELDAQGLRAATNAELLALGAQHSELQRENPIVGLSSRWRNPDGDVCVPVLFEFDGERELNLGWCEDRWLRNDRFAAVSK